MDPKFLRSKVGYHDHLTLEVIIYPLYPSGLFSDLILSFVKDHGSKMDSEVFSGQ